MARKVRGMNRSNWVAAVVDFSRRRTTRECSERFTTQNDGEATVRQLVEDNRDARFTFGMRQIGNRLPASAGDERTCADYSEEAIPERDPSFRTQGSTLSEAQT